MSLDLKAYDDDVPLGARADGRPSKKIVRLEHAFHSIGSLVATFTFGANSAL